jgi:hypothetical protein
MQQDARDRQTRTRTCMDGLHGFLLTCDCDAMRASGLGGTAPTAGPAPADPAPAPRGDSGGTSTVTCDGGGAAAEKPPPPAAEAERGDAGALRLCRRSSMSLRETTTGST